jgi:hypothetical protein
MSARFLDSSPFILWATSCRHRSVASLLDAEGKRPAILISSRFLSSLKGFAKAASWTVLKKWRSSGVRLVRFTSVLRKGIMCNFVNMACIKCKIKMMLSQNEVGCILKNI